MNEHIFQQVGTIFKDVFDDSTLAIDRTASAQTIPGWDSLTHVSLMVAVEKHFKIKILLGEVKNLMNVGDLLDLIEKKVAAKASK